MSLHPPTIKKVKLSRNQSHSKITNEVIGNNDDDIESKLDLQGLTISSQTSLVFKKWSLFINEKFVERVHYAWPDREYDA